jgi:tyrosinase
MNFATGVVFTLTVFGDGEVQAGGVGTPDASAVSVDPNDSVYDATANWRPGECPGGRPVGPTTRISATQLTTAQRAAYVAAVLRLKATPSPYDSTHTLSYYDQFVYWHQQLSHCQQTDPLNSHQMWGHAGPMFLAWHREFLALFQAALNSVSDHPIAIPYWDWTDRSSVKSVFADDFMGGNGNPADNNAVETGPFAKGKWKLKVLNYGTQSVLNGQNYLTRSFGPPGDLPLRSDVINVLEAPLYDVPPYNEDANDSISMRNALEGFPQDLAGSPAFDLCLPTNERFRVFNVAMRAQEGPHNLGHDWVGGTMAVIMTSPNDPVFFLHHANVDRIWAQWQQIHGVNTYSPTSGYPLNDLHSHMEPFWSSGIHVTPSDVLDIHKLGYSYEQTPNTSLSDRQVQAIKTESARRLRQWDSSPGERSAARALFTGRSFYCHHNAGFWHY